MKILLVAYAISPVRGSEPGIGWGWASSLARIHDVTVVAHPRYRDEVKSWIDAHPESTLDLRWIAPSREGEIQLTSALICAINYIRWLRLAVKMCKKLTATQTFDVIQFVSYGTISCSIPLGDLGVPFVLGPVGGAQRLNPMFQKALGPMPFEQRLRNIRISLLKHRRSIRSTVKRAGLVLVVNRETESLVSSCGGETVRFCDTGVKEEFLLKEPPLRQHRPGLRMLWVGRMLYRKGLPLVFHAMKAAGRTDLLLDVVGAGPMEPQWRNVVRDLGLERQVIFRGQVQFAQVFDFYDQADILVFPSVNDTFGSQLLEGLSRGLPVLALNHQGAGTLLPDSVAWKVPVDTVENTIRGLAKAMVSLADSPERLSAMSKAGLLFARSESWPSRIARMSAIYERLHNTDLNVNKGYRYAELNPLGS